GFEAKDLDRLKQRRQECKQRTGNGNGFGVTLGQAAPLWLGAWPTPVANDAKGSTHCYSRGNHEQIALKLPGAAQLASWPTPTARTNCEGLDAAIPEMQRKHAGGMPSLTVAVQLAASGPTQTGS